ncbi:MAG: hypothetical protein Q9P01_11820 [Anaerolineae bacterium]|nr:hypothetical protein [Anaerolineae bacterium]MDQ7035488.1 hypothetical protein [Anaerolineae bacterium]
MSTQLYEFQSHNSPWTEMFDMYCQREEMAESMSMQEDTQAEQQPTRDALADVYNRDTKTDTQSKRF